MEVISVNNLSKRFILNKQASTLKEWIIPSERISSRKKEFWALKDINLYVKKGDSLGIIGRNGSGKSTLLKIICQILYPTYGTVKVKGRISSLLELGAGFKQDYTGRENIFLNGSILGLSKKEIEAKFMSIVEFSELEEFIDQPVRNYSSGMYMRLAYSIAISTNPDILLVDEILAVGDDKFKQKGLERIQQLREQGATIILVSHSEGMIKKICNRVIWLDKGIKKMDGNPDEVFLAYNQ